MAKGRKKKNKIARKRVSRSIQPANLEEKSSEKLQFKTSHGQTFLQQLKLGESYVSLVLGAVVVLILAILFFIFLRGNSGNNSITETPSAFPSGVPAVTASEKMHVVEQDETLWDVAVKYYGDGFRYVEIIEANKLENPDYVPPGTRLIIPNAK